MNIPRWSKTALACLPLCLALAPAADEVTFHPKADSEVAKKLEIELELSLKDFSMTVNGQAIGKEAIEGLGDQGLIAHLAIGVKDTFVKSKDGKPTDLLRTFDAISMKTEIGEESNDSKDAGELENKTVRFLWNDEKHEYTKSFHESKGEEEKLAGLSVDMDLLCLLPEKKLAEGDTWEVSGEKLETLFVPGGVFGGGAKSDETSEILDELEKQLEPALKEFKVTCKYKGAHDDGKVRVAEIAFTYDGKAEIDLSSLIQKAIDEQGAEAGAAPEVEARTKLALRGEGTLLWDLGAGHLHSFTMQADVDLDAHITASMEQQGQSLEMEAQVTAGGKGTWDMKVE